MGAEGIRELLRAIDIDADRKLRAELKPPAPKPRSRRTPSA
jgi:hypothetical protein